MAYKTGKEAIAKRLLSHPPLVALVGQRVTPNIPDPQPPGDYVVFQLVSGGGGMNIEDRRGLQEYTYRLDVYATTNDAADKILAECRDRLFGNRRKGLPPWRDMANGVQGCFPQDDINSNVMEDATAENGQTFTLWFCPQE